MYEAFYLLVLLTGGNETARIGVDDVDGKELAPRCTKSVGRMRTFPTSLLSSSSEIAVSYLFDGGGSG